MCGKYLYVFGEYFNLIVHGECAKSNSARKENTRDLGLFLLHEIVSKSKQRIHMKKINRDGEYAKSISLFMQNRPIDINKTLLDKKAFDQRPPFLIG
jgi:hypothetical protein